MTKLLVIGLDAATWRVMDPLLEDGQLPHIADLMQEGVHAPLSTTVPPMTPLAWTSMVTGVNPGRHGIFDFLDQNSETHEIAPVDYAKMNTPAIWDVFANEGRTAGVVNFPLAHPPRRVDPFFIGGIPAHEKQTVAYPDEVQEYLDSINYDVHPHVDPEVDLHGFYRATKRLTQTQMKATEVLAGRYDPDLLWTVFMGLDWVQHHLWDEEIDGENACDCFYRYIDEVVGRLVELIDDDGHVCIVSDHGARRVNGVVHINSLLEELGYLTRDDPGGTVLEQARERLMNVAWTVGRRLPPGLKRLAKQYAPGTFQDEMRAAVGAGQRGMDKRIDWERTEAFSYGYMGRVFLNSEERFEEAPVSVERASALRESLAEDLRSVEHPETGRPIFERVLSREETYEGAHLAEAAELIAVPAAWEYSMFGDFGAEWVHPPDSRVADHDSEGVFVLSGPDVSGSPDELTVCDVAPTLLNLCGLPVVTGMEGKARQDILTADAREARDLSTVDNVPIRTPNESSSLDVDGKEEIEERLEDLGYM